MSLKKRLALCAVFIFFASLAGCSAYGSYPGDPESSAAASVAEESSSTLTADRYRDDMRENSLIATIPELGITEQPDKNSTEENKGVEILIGGQKTSFDWDFANSRRGYIRAYAGDFLGNGTQTLAVIVHLGDGTGTSQN